MLQYASPPHRIVALFTDGLIFLAVFLFYLIYFIMDEDGRFNFVQSFFSVEVLIFWIIYFPLSEGFSGQTIGKRIMQIRVASLEGELKFWQGFRRFFDVIDLLFFGLVGILVMSKSDKNQRIGDLVVGTIVIKHNAISCVQCTSKCVLSVEELNKGEFTCPECNHLNK